MGTECCQNDLNKESQSQDHPSAVKHDENSHVHDHKAHHPAHNSQQHDQYHHGQAHSRGHQHSHVHRDEHAHCADQDDCATKGEICQDAACCRIDDTCTSTTPTCCDTDDEYCDEKCIIAAAALECEKACENESKNPDAHLVHRHVHDDSGRHPSTACSDHLTKAFEKYTTYLESARCICRNVLERGWTKKCCGTQLQRKPPRKRNPADFTFASSRANKPSHHHHGIKYCNMGQPLHRASDHDSSCRSVGTDSCCRADENFCLGNKNSRTSLRDVERADGFERLAMHVEGMTCSGCGSKLEKSLKQVFGVSKVHVNFVMGHAECNFDPSLTTADHIIRSAQRTTGFKCAKLSSDHQNLDILASGAVANGIRSLGIPGVTDVLIINKKVVRVNYDPTVIGARNLLSQLPLDVDGLAPPSDDPTISSNRKRLYDQLIKAVLAASLTIPILIMVWGRVVKEPAKAIVSLVLASLVQMIAIPDFYRPALSSLFHSGNVEMDMLVVISITAAYLYSLVAVGFRLSGHPLKTAEFFETSTLLITLVIFGRLVAAFARVRAVKAVSLRSLQASSAVVVENGQDVEMDARLLQYGDTFKISAHKAVPTDGTIISGSSEIDESMLTGESMPVFKKEGDEIIAGTVNGTGTLVARLTRLPGKNTVTDIAKMVEEAASSKPRIQDVADRVASWFVPAVATLAVIVLVVWLIVGLVVQNHSTAEAVSNAITYTVATLAVSCPCALGLAVPMVLVVAGGVAARNGVIIKSAECTDRARKVTDVVFDKTGTITETELDVVTEEIFTSDKSLALAITKSLVTDNNHPVSLGVAKHLASQTIMPAAVTNVHVIPGAGVEAIIQGDVVRAGNPTWTRVNDDAAVKRLKARGLTLLVVTRSSKPMAIYGLCTRLRPEAFRVVKKLASCGITVHVVSGDLQQAVEAVAAQVGIPHVLAQQTPSEKRDYVAALMKEGKNVMFVGDGTNDAVAVTQADVGVQIVSALSTSEVTRGAADVVLLNGLEGIPFVLEVSRVSFRRMVFNFVWAAVYNVVAILLASGALVKVRIPPAYAGLGEIVSVLPVILAAMTMLLTKIKTE